MDDSGRYKRKHKRVQFLMKGLAYLFLLIVGITMVVPLVWMFSTSLKEEAAVASFPPEFIPREQVQLEYDGRKRKVAEVEYQGQLVEALELRIFKDQRDMLLLDTMKTITVPVSQVHYKKQVVLHWENYKDAWYAMTVKVFLFGKFRIKSAFSLFFLNSLYVAICVTLGQVITSSLAAYAFARLRFPFRDQLFLGYLATMMVPGVVTMIPVYALLGQLDLVNTYAALVVPGIFSAYGTFLLRQFFMGIPKELEDAALIDGANHLQIYAQVILPLAKPALATLTTFTFLGSWNGFMWPLIVAHDLELKTLPIGLAAFQGLHQTEWTLLMAASLVVMVPVILVFLFNQRYFVRGIVMSGIKG